MVRGQVKRSTGQVGIATQHRRGGGDAKTIISPNTSFGHITSPCIYFFYTDGKRPG